MINLISINQFISSEKPYWRI